ncbi:MAG TPA: hypothetical protein VKE72_09735 [Methylocella sp.]|nr:hypothetical protein [Methylocella sp.]
MPKSNISLLIPFSLLLVAMTGGAAFGQEGGPTPPFNSYAAMFVCGQTTSDSDVVRGTYATSIGMKVVVDLPEGQKPVPPVVLNAAETLGADLAERVDCSTILAALGLPAQAHVEGFLVLQVPPITNPDGSTTPVFLDVIGKNSVRPILTGVSGFQIARYPATNVTN